MNNFVPRCCRTAVTRLLTHVLILLVAFTVVGCGTGNTQNFTSVPSSNSSVQRTTIFIGASTIELWPQFADFPSRGWVAKGVSGETSAQVLARFDNDVVAQHPYAVLINCGANDMATWKYNAGTLLANWTEMVNKAKAAGIKVYLSTLQPFGTDASGDPVRNQRINEANENMKNLATSSGSTLVDLHSVLVGSNGYFQPSMTTDGLHPSKQGYQAMTALADQIIK